MLTLDAARSLAVAAALELKALPVEYLDITLAHGRVLAEDVVSSRAVPGFACSAMDGYAFRHAHLVAAGTRTLREDGATLAGDVEIAPLAAQACRRITTGAPIPSGADTVAMHERTRRVEQGSGGAYIAFDEIPTAAANVRAESDDFPQGHLALSKGQRLDAVAIACAVTLGRRELAVARMPNVAALTTGDELLAPGAPWQHGLRYDSNGPLLKGLLAESGMHHVHRMHVRDDPDALRLALLEAVDTCPLIICTGGVSAGEADHLPAVLEELGSIVFWKLRFRPGMPALCARIGESLVFGLPGNPVSVLATFVALVRPVLAAWTGCAALDPAPVMARLLEPLSKRHDRLEWRRGTLEWNGDGEARACGHALLSSGAMRSLLESNVLIELAADRMEFDAGSLVPVRRWSAP